MKNLSKLTILLALVFGYSTQAQAGLLIEPVVGYSVGKFNSEYEFGGATVQKDDDSLKGTSYGGRLGYQNLGFQLGLDYLASSLQIDGNDFGTSEFAGFVGFEFPILVRVYAGYVFSGTGTLEDDNGDESKLKGGTGPKIGVGFTLLPFLDINLEYRRVTYDSFDAGAGATLDADYSATMLSFSLPFVL